VPLYADGTLSQGVLLVDSALWSLSLAPGFCSLARAIIGSEIFPTQRAGSCALGFTYNGARTMSSVAPLVIGRVGQMKGLGWAFYLCAAGYLMAALLTTQLPETRGKKLE
jgi:hypothetical protein